MASPIPGDEFVVGLLWGGRLLGGAALGYASWKLPPKISKAIEVIGGLWGILTGSPRPRRIEPEGPRQEQVGEGPAPPPLPPPDKTER